MTLRPVKPGQIATLAHIADSYGVSIQTLRLYEDRGLLHPTRQGEDRFYTARDEVRLQLILKGRRLGFTLEEIGLLIDGDLRRFHNGEHAG